MKKIICIIMTVATLLFCVTAALTACSDDTVTGETPAEGDGRVPGLPEGAAARSPQELAALSEQSYRDRVKYAAEKVRLSGTKIVMLTGPSASGKTTSAHCLAKALVQQGTPAQVVSLDNFFKTVLREQCCAR